MIQGTIHSENPEDHWKHIDTKGGIVLDLGCGFNDEESRRNRWSTPYYFLKQGASVIVGLDMNEDDIKLIRSEITGIYSAEKIEKPSDISRYIELLQPTHLKCDIEGSEMVLFEVDPQSVKWVAIETHGPQYRSSLNNWLSKWGFSIYAVEKLASADYIDIVYASRP